MNILQIKTSFRKELWEFKKTLFWVPVIIAALMILAPFLQFMLLEDYQLDRIVDGLTQLEDVSNVRFFAHGVLAAISAMFVPFMLVGLIIQLYYFTSCLFDERRDLSVYFWRSLPVSDGLNVLVKLLTGALVIPAIFMLAATAVLVVALFLLFIACIVLSSSFDISLWALWGEAELVSSLVAVWVNIFPYAIWLFPIYAWLMLASMFAGKAPFLWAVLPLVVVLLIESFVVRYLHLDSHFFGDMLREYIEFSEHMFPQRFSDVGSSKFVLFSALSKKISLVATIIGCGFMYLTYWLRVNRSQA